MPVGSGLFSAGLASAGGMGTRIGAAFVEIFADTSGLQRGFASAETLATSFGARMQASGAIIGRVGTSITRNLSLPLAALGGVSVKMASDFETAMTRTTALASAGKVPIDDLRGAVLKLSEETAQAPTDLADSLFFVASAGLKGSQVMPVLEMTAKGAAAQLGEAADLGQLLTSVMVAYADKAPSAASAMDTLVQAVREGKAEPADLAAAMGTVVPVAAQMGVEFDQLAGAIAAATNVGVESARAATGLRYMMIQLQNPTEAAKKELANYGLTVQQVQHAVRDDLLGGLELLGDAMLTQGAKGKEAFFTTIGGVRSGQVALALMGKSAERTRDIMDATARAAGGQADEFEKAFKKMTETPGFKFQKAWNDLKLAAIDAGSVLLPLVQDLVENIADLARMFTSLPNSVQKSIISFGLFVIAAGPILSVFGRLLSIGGSVIRMFESLGTGAVAAATATKTAGVAGAAGAAAPGAVPAAAGLTRVAGIATGMAEAGGIALIVAGVAATANRLVDVWGTTTEELAEQTGMTTEAVSILDEQLRFTGSAFNLFADRGDKVREGGESLSAIVKQLTEDGYSTANAWEKVNEVLEASSQDIGGLTGSMDTLDQNVRARLGLLTGEAAKTLGERRFGEVVDQAISMIPQGQGEFRREFDLSSTSVKEFRAMLISLKESGIDVADAIGGPISEALQSGAITWTELESLFGRFELPFARIKDDYTQMALIFGTGGADAKQALADSIVDLQDIGIDPSTIRGFVQANDDVLNGTGTLAEAMDALWEGSAPRMIDTISEMSSTLNDHQIELLATAAAEENWLGVLRLIEKFRTKPTPKEKAEVGTWQDPQTRKDAAEFFELSEKFGEAWARILQPGKGEQPVAITRTVENFKELGGTLKDLPKKQRVDLEVALEKGDTQTALNILLRAIRRLDRAHAEPEVKVKGDAKEDIQEVDGYLHDLDGYTAWTTVNANTDPASASIQALLGSIPSSVSIGITTPSEVRGVPIKPDDGQTGGWVPGTGRGDIVPMMLEPGEFIVRRRSAQQLRGAMEEINRKGAMAFHRPAGRSRGSAPIMTSARAGKPGGEGGGGSKTLNVNVAGRMEYTPDDLRRNLEGWWRRRDW